MKRKVKEESVQAIPNSQELDKLREILRDKFGEEVITIHTDIRKIPSIPTGILRLDNALDGGIAIGRMTELMGKQSSGKTTIALIIAAKAQQLFPNKNVIYVDTERSLDLKWAVKLGIDLSRFDHIEPTTGEDAFIIIEEYIKSGHASVIILDSVPASVPAAALNGDIGDANIGLQARLMAQVIPRLLTPLAKTKTSLILINQKRANLQARGGFAGYEPVKSTGGMALPFYMSTRLDISRIGTVKDNEDKEIGQVVQVHVLKHKLGLGPGAKIVFQIVNAIGIDYAQEILELGEEKGLLKKSGSWFLIGDEKVQGEEKAKQLILQQKNKWLDKIKGT